TRRSERARAAVPRPSQARTAAYQTGPRLRQEIRLLDLAAGQGEPVHDPAQERADAAATDFRRVRVPQVAVEPAEPPLRGGAAGRPAADLAQCFETPADAVPH